MPASVFIAYARTHIAFARAVKAELAGRGVEAFTDEDVRGEDWDPVILAAHQAARLTLGHVTEDALDSDHWQVEVTRARRWAKERGHRVMLVVDPSARPWDLWPSGIARSDHWPLPPRRVTPAEVADRALECLGRAAPSAIRLATPPPSPDLVRDIAAWLQDHHPRPLHRKTVFEQAGLAASDAPDWGKALEGRSTDDLRRLLEAGAENPAEIEPFILLLQATAPAKSFEDAVEARLEVFCVQGSALRVAHSIPI